jgi:hypothetical protein
MNDEPLPVETKPYESVKLYTDDKPKVSSISKTTGLAEIAAVGAALDGWPHLPKKIRDRIVLSRMSRGAGRARRRRKSVAA